MLPCTTGDTGALPARVGARETGEMMRTKSLIALLRAFGFRVRRTSVRVNDRPAYRLQFPAEREERWTYYSEDGLMRVLAAELN